MPASPRLSIARRVDSSGIDLKIRRFTLGVFRQYRSLASSTSSTPGVKLTNLYGPAPTGAFLKPSSPTRSTYFFGTTHKAPVANVPTNAGKSGDGSLKTKRIFVGLTTTTSLTIVFSSFDDPPRK